MQKTARPGVYRATLTSLTAQRLRQIALYHGKSETAILTDLIARQYAFDADGIKGALDKLADSDTDSLDGMPT